MIKFPFDSKAIIAGENFKMVCNFSFKKKLLYKNLAKCNWNNILSSFDAHEAYDKFINIIQTQFDVCFLF